MIVLASGRSISESVSSLWIFSDRTVTVTLSGIYPSAGCLMGVRRSTSGGTAGSEKPNRLAIDPTPWPLVAVVVSPTVVFTATAPPLLAVFLIDVSRLAVAVTPFDAVGLDNGLAQSVY